MAASLPGVTAGRQVNEHDLLYSAVSPDGFRRLKELARFLSEDEKACLKELAIIMREESPLWGV